jgi:hypothetical protein
MSFKPVVYVKQHCPFCMKLRLFLLESGMLDKVELREVIPGAPDEQKLRDELAPHFEKVTLPAAQIAPGVWMKDSDALVDKFAEISGIAPASLPNLQSYIGGPFASIMRLYKENTELKKQLA